MNFTESQENAQRALSKLINKCWEDETFKQELIANPVPTMEKFYGGPLKKKGNVVVTDQTDESVIYLNIPSTPDFEDYRLTDSELEAVAGGWFVTLFWSSICFGDGEPASTDVSLSV